MTDKITIKIDGIGPVQVDASFKGLSVDEQQRTVDEIHRSYMAQQAKPSAVEDVSKSAVSGVLGTLSGLATMPKALGELGATGFEKGYSLLTGEKPSDDFMSGMRTSIGMMPDIAGTVAEVAPISQYEPQTIAGEYTKTGAEFATTAVGGGTKALVQYGILPALASETAGQLTKGTRAEAPARLIAAILTPSGEGIFRRIVSPTGGKVDAPMREAVDLLAKENVFPSVGQASGNKVIQYMEDATEAGRELQRMTAGNFTRAALKKVGVDADRATPDVINKIDENLKTLYNQSIQQSKYVPSVDDVKSVANVALRYKRTASSPSELYDYYLKKFRKAADFRQRITGPEFQEMWSELGPLSLQGGADGVAAREMRKLLEDMIGKGMPDGQKEVWKQARKTSQNFMAIKKALQTGGDNEMAGYISPNRLNIGVNQVFGDKVLKGQSELADLARAGKLILKKMPESGTDARNAARNLGMGTASTTTGGAAGLAAGLDPSGAGQLALALGMAPYAVNRLLATPQGQAYLRNQVMGLGPEYFGQQQGLLRILGGFGLSQQ